MREVSKTNRILSLVLCVCMVLSMVPGCVLPVQAEGADSVCTCESSDPNGHAPFCDLYIAPENPACYCVAKCNEGNTNEYCDVCYFAPDACAASGEEDAALYASSYNYITSLTVGYSSKSASSAKEYASKDSHTVIDVDLNMDAGGDYVYMGYKTSSSPSNAITGIIFDDSGSESITYNGTTFYVLGGSKEPNASGDGKVDLNRDAKGAYIYVYITRDPGYDLPLTDITIGTAQETDIWWEPGCNRDNGKVQDLNQDTGDTPIYLYYNTKYTVAYECHYLKADGSTGKKSGEKQIYELNGTASYLPDVNDNPTGTAQKITSIPEHITYNGESYTFVGLREDNTVDSPTYYYLPEGYGGFQSKPTFTIKDTTRVFRAVYIHSEIRIKYNPNGGTITSGTNTAINSYWLLAGSNGVLGGYLDYTVWDMASRIKAPENKCAFLGWRIDNTGTTYNGGDKVNLTKDTTFYARWSDHTLINNVCTSCGYSNAVPSLVNGVYQIGNKAELIWFAQYVNKGNTGANAKLTADIDMSGYNWTPIVSTALYHSTTSYPNKGYTGTFDGNYHSISNLTIQAVSGDPDASYGLFGTLSGTVKNLGMKNFKFTGAGMDTRVGTVVGQMLSGALVENCYANTGNINTKVNTTNGVAGGIAGCNYGGTIRGCLLLNYTFNAGRHSGIVGDNRGDISSSDRKGTVVNCVTDYSTIQSKDRTGTVTNSLSGLNDTRLASGEAAWTLNGNSSSGVWKQTVGTGVPAFTGKTVYYGYLSCAADAAMAYTNDSSASTTKPDHSWADADCDTPKTCKICGKTEGNALDHDWKAADCNTPKTCKLCGKTEGNALDHDWKAADCDTRKTCKICGKTEGNALGHSYTNGFCTVCSGYQPATGIGSPKDPYKIGNAGQLYWFADRVNSGKTSVQAELTADIVVNENVLKADGTLNEGTYRTWKPIGNLINKYSGSFDGKGYTVSGLYFNYSNSSYVGMFGYVSGGTVQNVGVVDSYISGSDYVGGVVGYKEYGAVTNCYHTGTVSGVKYVGGMIGSNKRCLVTKCYHTGTVSGKDHIGSVVGYIYSSSTVTNCYYDCTVYNGDAVGVNAGCTVTDVMGKTTEQFASGEVAYLLQGEQTEQVWGQNIDGEGEKDAYPVFSDAKVYQILNCVGVPAGYSNTEGKDAVHSYTNGFCTGCDSYEPATGSGTESDPYKIGNAGQLYWFADQVNSGKTSAWAELTADIVVNENVLNADGTLNEGTYRTWKPIGTSSDIYSGSFDGKSYTVSGLYFDDSTVDYVGLIGYVDYAIVQNVGVVDSYLRGSDCVGGVVGYTYGGTVINCYNTGTVSGEEEVGGVVGHNRGGTVIDCYNTGTVSGEDDVGGVVGYINGGTIINCYHTGTVSGSSNFIGGVVGFNSNSSTVTNCYHTGTVSGAWSVGGVVGYIDSSSSVTNCYYDSTVYNGDAVEGSSSAIVTDVMGKTTEQFASGEVAYLLSLGCTVGEGEAAVTYPGDIWGQNIDGEGEKDAYPVFSDAKVYAILNCVGAPAGYSNTEGVALGHDWTGAGCDAPKTCKICGAIEGNTLDHSYTNGFCTGCDGYEPATGSGTESDPYKIGNAGQLYWFADQVNSGNTSAWAELTTDIVVNENVLNADCTLNEGTYRSWTPIGNNESGYSGIFDGKGYTVSGVYFNYGPVKYIGLFGYVYSGTVQNVGVVHSFLFADRSVGGVVGGNYGTVINCYNTGTVIGRNSVGGVVGSNYGTVTNCYNTGTVSGRDSVGGVVGYNNGGIVTNCYYDSTVYNGDAVGENGGGTVTDVMGKTTEQFASGEVAYLLQGEQTEQVWGQNIDGEGEKDAYPVFSDAKVYAILNCNNEPVGYSNTESDALGHDWQDDDGDTIRTCTICGITECYVLGHHYSTQWSYDHTNHWRECPCGERTDYQKHESENCRCGFVEADVYVGGVGMADGQYLSNSGAISADPPSGGYAFYQNGVLTLHDYVYTGTGYAYRGTRTAAIYSGGDLEIVLEGTNSLTNTFGSEDAIGNGILCSDLTIRGTGSLNIESMSVCISAQGDLSISDCTISVQSANDYGLYANYDEGIGNLTIDNATLNITAGDTGIYIRENATISGSTITMDAGKDGIYSENDVTINGSNVTITCDASDSQDGGAIVGRVISIVDSTLDATCNGEASCIMSVDYIDQSDLCVRITNSNVSIHGGMAGVLSYGEIIITGGKLTVADTGMAAMAALGGITLNQVSIAQPVGGSIGTLQGMYITLEADGETFATAVVIDNTCEHSNASDDSDCTTPVICPDCGTMITAAKEHSWIAADCDTPKTCSFCGTTEGDALSHKDADDSGRCDKCNCLMQPARLRMASISMNGNIAINYYMLLSDEVLADETAYMQFTMVDGTVTRIPVADGIRAEYNGETYYAFSCAVDSKEMTDDVVCQFFYEGGSTAPFTYNVQTYANNILAKSGNDTMKALVRAMLHYGAASQIHFGYNTDNLANAELAAPDYSDVSIEGFDVISGQGTELAKFYSASLILKSETTLRFFFRVDSAATFTATYNGQTLEVKQRSGLYYVDVVGIAAKDLDEDVTITINDGTNTAGVSFNPMSYCQGVLNDTTGAFDRNIKDVVAALYLYNQAANIYFKES